MSSPRACPRTILAASMAALLLAAGGAAEEKRAPDKNPHALSGRAEHFQAESNEYALRVYASSSVARVTE